MTGQNQGAGSGTSGYGAGAGTGSGAGAVVVASAPTATDGTVELLDKLITFTGAVVVVPLLESSSDGAVVAVLETDALVELALSISGKSLLSSVANV